MNVADLHTPRLRMRHVHPDDYATLHGIEADPTTAQTWRYRGQLPPIEEYEPALWQQTTAILVMESTTSRSIIGYCQLYDLDLRAGHGWFSVYAAPHRRGAGLAMEGLTLFVEWAFANWPLRWLYAHTFASNIAAFHSGVRRGHAAHLGTLQERVVVDDQLMDVHVLGIERDQFHRSSIRRRVRTLNSDANGR